MIPRPLLGGLFALLVLFLFADRASAEGLKVQMLRTDEERTIRAIRVLDLDGDGKQEIVSFLDGGPGPAISVHVPGKDGAYPGGPTVVLEFAGLGLTGVYFATVARTGENGAGEIILVDRSGIFAFRFEKGGLAKEPRRLGDTPPLPFHPDEDRICVLDMGADLDGDGREELIVPAPDGYLVLGGEALPTGIRLSVTRNPHRFFTLTWELPRLTVADWDGDGLADLIAGTDGALRLFLQRKDGTFLTVTPHPLDILKPGREDAERRTLSLADVDGDRRVDLIVTQSPATVELLQKFTSQVSLFLNPRIIPPGDTGKLSTPKMSFKIDGFSVNPAFFDFDDDGDLDLLLTALVFDVWGKLRGTITAKYQVFLFDAEKRAYERSPLFKLSLPFPTRQLDRQSTAPVCFFSGDFDGDGKNDLLNIADEGGVVILRGTSDTGFLNPDRYAFREEILRVKPQEELSNDVWIGDLNGDGVSDFVSFGGRRIYVVRSVK